MAALQCGTPSDELVAIAEERSRTTVPATCVNYLRISSLLSSFRKGNDSEKYITVASHLSNFLEDSCFGGSCTPTVLSTSEFEALSSCSPGTEAPESSLVSVAGWCKTIRLQDAGRLAFVIINDGSCKADLQLVVHKGVEDFDDVCKATAGASIHAVGTLVERPNAKAAQSDAGEFQPLESISQKYEVHVTCIKGHSIKVVGKNHDPKSYPIAKKYVTPEVLREVIHLRPRTYLISAIMRVRSALALATHLFFQKQGYFYIHTPIITTADCEGAGELFQVTTLLSDAKSVQDLARQVAQKNSKAQEAYTDLLLDYKRDFFKRKAFLTCSGQLSAESFACSMGKVYTFGPTFRAENSHTTRHLAEFWMIEPEMDHVDLEMNMKIAEAYIKFCLGYVLDHCMDDILYLEKVNEQGLVDKLKNIVKEEFVRLSYTDAIEILQLHEKAYEDGLVQIPEGSARPKAFEHPVSWGIDLQSEHERFIAECVFKRPTIIYNYPAAIKAFYMRRNDDGKTCAAMDIIVPRFGELVGGSQREERLHVLEASIAENGLNRQDYWWYLELRSYGTIPHSGFGLGFERLVMLTTGAANIRDVIPCPRFPGNANF